MKSSFGSFVKKESLHILRDKRTMLVVMLIPVMLMIFLISENEIMESFFQSDLCIGVHISAPVKILGEPAHNTFAVDGEQVSGIGTDTERIRSGFRHIKRTFEVKERAYAGIGGLPGERKLCIFPFPVDNLLPDVEKLILQSLCGIGIQDFPDRVFCFPLFCAVTADRGFLPGFKTGIVFRREQCKIRTEQ